MVLRVRGPLVVLLRQHRLLFKRPAKGVRLVFFISLARAGDDFEGEASGLPGCRYGPEHVIDLRLLLMNDLERLLRLHWQGALVLRHLARKLNDFEAGLAVGPYGNSLLDGLPHFYLSQAR